MRWKLHSVRSNGCTHVEICESIMHQPLLSLPNERFCSLIRKIKYMKTWHTETRGISIKNSRRCWERFLKEIGTRSFRRSGSGSFRRRECVRSQRILLSEFGNFVDHPASKIGSNFAVVIIFHTVVYVIIS